LLVAAPAEGDGAIEVEIGTAARPFDHIVDVKLAALLGSFCIFSSSRGNRGRRFRAVGANWPHKSALIGECEIGWAKLDCLARSTFGSRTGL
jgi:hypothetical protein